MRGVSAQSARAWRGALRGVVGFGVSCLLTCLSLDLSGQDLGGLPGTLDWYRYGDDTVTLITTAPTADFAARALALDRGLIALRPYPLGERVDEIDIVVQPSTVVANGFVGLEPYRSYLYATPPQSPRALSTTSWADLLAVHEYRHVEQYANLNRGWTRFFGTVFGDGGRGVLQGLSTPDWFFEGDATYAETALTPAGRGRTPDFTALQRALARAGTRYPYAKARNGSLRSRVPNQYPLGLALVNHGRQVYGDPWPEVVRGAGIFWPPVYPFSLALKRATGHHTPSFYREAYDSLARVWNARVAALDTTPSRTVIAPTRQLDVFASPLPYALDGRPAAGLPDGGLLAVRRSQTRTPELVAVAPDGSDLRVLTAMGARVDEGISYANRRVVWAELQLNPRRPNETFSVLARYDLPTGRTTRLTRGTKLLSPGLSPDGNTIVAAEVQVGLPPKLAYYNANDGTRLRAHAAPPGYELLASPRFTPDGAAVVALAKTRAGVRYELRGAATGELLRALTPWTHHTLGPPYPHGEHVYFAASFTGIDNVFRARLDATGPLEQLTSAAVSATQPSTDGANLYYVSVTPRGDPVEAVARADWLLRPLSRDAIVEPAALPQYAPFEPTGPALAFRERFFGEDLRGGGAPEDPSPRGAAAPAEAADLPNPRRYRSLLRGFSLYTLQPLLNATEASATLFGGNVLGDLATELTAGYNLNERRGFGSVDVTLARTWPWIELGGGLAERRYNVLTMPTDTTLALPSVRFEQARVGGGLSAPAVQRLGAYVARARPSAHLEHFRFSTDEVGEGDAPQTLPGTDALTAVDLDLTLGITRLQAPKEIVPRWGLLAAARHRRALGGGGATQTTASATAFAPGLARSHGLVLRAAVRLEPIQNAFQFPDFFRYARGLAKPVHDRAATFSVEYHLPLLYPDVGAAGLVYARRLRAVAWADYTRLRLPAPFRERDDGMGSVGVDLVGDFTFFNVEDLPVGVRLAYVTRADRFGFTEEGWADVRLLLALPF